LVRFNGSSAIGQKSMLIAQISDTHIVECGERASGFAMTDGYLEQCVAHINLHQPAVDLVLHSGDISHSGRSDQLNNAKQLLAQLHCPYFVVPGNHDDRDSIREHFYQQAGSGRSQNFIQYVVEGYALRLIALDTTIPGEPGGEICVVRADWLDQCLSEQPDKPSVIFMHHPPLKLGVRETDVDGFSGAELLASVLKKHQNVVRILCGHIHLASCTSWEGTLVSTAPSTGMKLVLDLDLTAPSQFVLDVPQYQLHYWTDQGCLVSHTVRVDDSKKQRHDW